MGKLHTLRRAIERDPGMWHTHGGYAVRGARFYGGQWLPCWWRVSYKAYVKSVLKELGLYKEPVKVSRKVMKGIWIKIKAG